ncbi:hypothetical protein TI05_07075 [Achromatium sp. WMS3]|nr:hypothetical protein TI05_07075 [Achromatium sp. WMS3]
MHNTLYNKRLLIPILMITPLLLNGCGQVAEIPPAHVGKLSTPSGLQKGIIYPSKIRLSSFCVTCDNLILAEASDYPVKESMQIFMPKDKLNLQVDVRGTFSISNDPQNIDNIFARIPAQPINDRLSKITTMQVYVTYAQPIVRETVRSVITRYDIMQIMSNRDVISQELAKLVSKRLQGTPITTIRFGLADMQPPQVILEAQEAAKKREIEIQRAEADKLVKLKEAEAAYEVALKQQQVDLKEAETQVLVNQKLSEGVNSAFVAQRALRILEKLAESNNKVIFLPTEALSNPAILLGPINQSLLVPSKRSR